MKRAIVLVAALAFAPLAGAQLYKYVDKDGKTVYSDQPPANIDSKQLNIGSRGSAPNAGAPKSALERDKDLEKGRKDARESAEKADKAARKADDDQKNCLAAKSAYQTYVEGGRIHKYNDKGEREYLGDAEMDVEREKARRAMDEACKKG